MTRQECIDLLRQCARHLEEETHQQDYIFPAWPTRDDATSLADFAYSGTIRKAARAIAADTALTIDDASRVPTEYVGHLVRYIADLFEE